METLLWSNVNAFLELFLLAEEYVFVAFMATLFVFEDGLLLVCIRGNRSALWFWGEWGCGVWGWMVVWEGD
ncbi:hypothetical protein [Noviherbaspirillum saxi]|uniref:hypothetical protein n=1 Tax=Noviherbaspirillum saxi TaxID=2320863 RepID=UPI0011C3A75F|nr:hypothetical protein [Noviherbaspirillum saxi]